MIQNPTHFWVILGMVYQWRLTYDVPGTVPGRWLRLSFRDLVFTVFTAVCGWHLYESNDVFQYRTFGVVLCVAVHFLAFAAISQNQINKQKKNHKTQIDLALSTRNGPNQITPNETRRKLHIRSPFWTPSAIDITNHVKIAWSTWGQQELKIRHGGRPISWILLRNL